jgi:hypothetical protein
MADQPVDVAYGYGVWLRHLAGLQKAGISGPFDRVAELGPGNSVAVGICALLSGATSYVGLDVLPHLSFSRATYVLDELLELFSRSASIPSGESYAGVYPPVVDYTFPEAAIEAFRGNRRDSMDESALRSAVLKLETGDSSSQMIRSICPWDQHSLPKGSVDLVLSQAVLQEIPPKSPENPLLAAFCATANFLRTGGIASHQIDLGFYGRGPWNIHWTWSDLEWRLIRGRRDNYVNREPLGTYLALAKQAGFEIVRVEVVNDPGVPISSLSPRFRGLPESERTARAAHLILRKR